ncbi:hypothetical protein SMICM17S_08691 [Streptomyces microflavus]
MQIRLTVLAPRSGQTPARACDVLVTAPAGTALAAVASGLAQAVSGPEGSQGGGAVVLFAGRERLDAQRIALGEPPLVDGAVLSLQVPGEDEATDDAGPAQLHVVAGPDAGGAICCTAAGSGSAAPPRPMSRWTTRTCPGCTAR